MHTPMASPYPSYAEENGSLDGRASRNWSAGTLGIICGFMFLNFLGPKPGTLAKHPPWFPISSPVPSSPSSPGSPMHSPSLSPGPTFPSTPTNDDSHSSDVRRSVFQRTRSLSLSDKMYLTVARCFTLVCLHFFKRNVSADDGPIFNVRNNQPFAPPNTGTPAANSSMHSNYYFSQASNPVNLPPISVGSSMQRTVSFLDFAPTSPRICKHVL
jgi:hypothetical protein